MVGVDLGLGDWEPLLWIENRLVWFETISGWVRSSPDGVFGVGVIRGVDLGVSGAGVDCKAEARALGPRFNGGGGPM